MKRSHQSPKPHPFTEAQIRERAYQLWQERGESASSDDNWQAAIETLKQERSPVWKIRQWLLFPFRLLARVLRFLWRLPGQVARLVRLALTAETPSAALDVVKVVISGLGLIATVFAGIGLVVNYQQGQERLITDRFAKSVEQLGSQDIDVRLGGIYSLERIAKDSPKDHWTVMEVLTAFVRNKSPLPKGWEDTPLEKRQLLSRVAIDAQSASAVIGRRGTEHDSEKRRLDLSRSNLSRANLFDANLSGADLRNTNLSDANLSGGDLRNTNLSDASLNGADLRNTDLSKAHLFHANLFFVSLSFANLSFADLSFANLSFAQLFGANLSFAQLFDANLRKADLRNTDLSNADLAKADLSFAVLLDARGITPTQIKQAKNWEKAHYEPAFRKQLGLPPEKH